MWAPYPAGVTALTPQQFAQYARVGIKRGWPDLMIAYKRMYGIELKTRRGRLTKTRVTHTRRGTPRELIGQLEMHELLVKSGAWGGIAVARSVDEVCAWLDEWGIPRIGGGRWLVALQGHKSAPLGEIFGRRAAGDSYAESET